MTIGYKRLSMEAKHIYFITIVEPAYSEYIYALKTKKSKS